MYRTTLLLFIFICFSSFETTQECFNTNLYNHSSANEDFFGFKELSMDLINLKTSLFKKQYDYEELKNADSINRIRDIRLVSNTIENVTWLQSTAMKTQVEISFSYRSSLTRVSIATRQLSNTKYFTKSDEDRLLGIHNDIEAKCEAVQTNLQTGYKGVTVTVRTADRFNNEKKGFLVCWAFSFDDRHQLNIKQCFQENSSTTTDSLFVPGDYVFWAEKLNKKGDETFIAGPKKPLNIHLSDNRVDLFVK